jgi:Peptidase_C39 like family
MMAEEPVASDRANAFVAQLRSGKLSGSLDLLLNVPDVWGVTPDRLDAEFGVPEGVKLPKNPYFQWMTTGRTRAVFMKKPYSDVTLDLKLFDGLSAEEVIVDFADGKLNGITFSIYNKGDSGEIDSAEFQRRFRICGKRLGESFQIRPTQRKADPAQGLMAEGWLWVSQRGLALLEHNPEAESGKVEFLRLKIAPREVKGAFAASFQGRAAAAKLSDLPKNVVKKADGDVMIRDIPMVDQGPKGYCVVATTQRLFEYYGIPADQHQIAQVAGTDATQGTNPLKMAEALGKIDFRFKTRFKILGLKNGATLVEVDERKMTVGKRVDEAKFSKDIHQSIDDGVPVLWGLELGRFPEEPSIAQQTGGGHMRMIIGYNDRTGHLLFSDSWGAGHECKRMTLNHAYQATLGYFAMAPTVR